MTYQAPWTWDEMAEARDDMIALMNASPEPVNVMIDYSAGGDAPRGLIARFGEMLPDYPTAKQKQVMVIGLTAGFVKQAAEIFSRVFVRLTFAKTYEEATALLRAEENDEAR